MTSLPVMRPGEMNEGRAPDWNALEAPANRESSLGRPRVSASPFALLGIDRVPATFTSRLIGFDAGSAVSTHYASVGSGRWVSDFSSTPDYVSNRLFDLKTATAEVAMHLETAWRSGLFRQLDDLLDDESWDIGDVLPSHASFRTFLRLIVDLGRPNRPSLGCGDEGIPGR